MSNVCKLCRRFIISQAVTFADGTLTINLPAGSYNNGEKYCIVIAQVPPAETTIAAPVVITIGEGTEEYPLTGRGGAQILARGIWPRTRYATVVSTNATGGSFQLLGNPCCTPDNRLTSINGTAPAAAPAEGGA